MDDKRKRAKQFYNALDFDKPINFGLDRLVSAERALPEKIYVPCIHGGSERDPVEELANQIDFSLSAGSYLFSGNRGTGKTTELLRLARRLEELSCEVFYVDMADYLPLTQRIEVTDFLISVIGAFSEKAAERIGENPAGAGYLERVLQFLQAEVSFDEIKLPAGPIEFKASLNQNPSFKRELQKKTRGVVERLVEQARAYVLDVVEALRQKRSDPDLKIVLIVNSIERLRGVGDSQDVREIFKSAETLFASHADKLRFSGLNTIYTVPPYLSALAGGLGAYYAGGRIYTLPSLHIYTCCPEPGKAPATDETGIAKMRDIVDRRFAFWRDFFTEAALARLAQSSGGDLRDYFRMLRLALARAPQSALPLSGGIVEDAENAVRNDMLPIADDDRVWLQEISRTHKPALPSLDKLPDFARLQQGKYVLNYRNGEDWYDLHPLLRMELDGNGGRRT